MTKKSTQPAVSELLSIAARLELEKMDTLGDCPIFRVDEVWKALVLTKEENAAIASTLRELTDALEDDTVHSLFIPAYSLGYEALASVLTRYQVNKVIYWETGEVDV